MQHDLVIKRWLRTSELAAGIGLVGLTILAIGILVDVVMRAVFNNPIYGLSDLAEIVTPPIVASCFPAALAARQNITIRFLGKAVPNRMAQAIELFGQIVATLVIVGITWQVALYTMGMVKNDQVTWLLQLPAWPSWILTTLLLIACIPIQLMVLAETWSALMKGQALVDDAIDPDQTI